MSGTKKRPEESYGSTNIVRSTTVVPDGYKDMVKDHINSAYVGTILRIYDPAYSIEGQLATAHWATEKGVLSPCMMN